MTDKLIAFYLDFVNDFLTVKNYAEYHNISEIECEIMLKAGKELNELLQ